MSSKKTNVSDEFDTLKSDVAKLRSDLSTTTKKLIDVGKDQTGEAKEIAKIEAAKLLSELEDAVDESKQKGKRALESVEDKIIEKPLLSLLVAFVIGLLIGKVVDNHNS